MSRSATNYQVLYFEEWWEEDYEYTYSGIPYMEGNSPILSYGVPSWFRSQLIADSFWGKVHHSIEIKIDSVTENYRLQGTSEHLLPDSTPCTVTEIWEGTDFDDNTIYGPTTVTTSKTIAQLELSIPFFRKSRSADITGLTETPWFNFSCGEAGSHYCSAITWYGETLNWPTLNFTEDYDVVVTSGIYTGERVFGSISLVSGGSILCGCDGGYERNGCLRLASYHVDVGIVGQGPNYYHLKADPVDLDGNIVHVDSIDESRHRCFVLFGTIYRIDAADSHKIKTVDYATSTLDVSDYVTVKSLPLDENYDFPLERVRDNSVVEITTASVGGFTTPAIPGWENYPTEVFPIRYQVDHEQEIRSDLNIVQIVLDRHHFFNLDEASTNLANFDQAHPGCLGLHRYHEDALATCRQVATIQQLTSKTLGLGYYSGWTANPGASFAMDGTKMVFTTSGSGNFFLSNPQTFNFRPYRYFTFDYEVISGGSVSLEMKLNDLVSTRAQKTYSCILNGSGTMSIDLCYPVDILTGVGGEGATLMASKLTTENQADRTGVSDTAYAGTGIPLKERLSGFRGAFDITFTFSNGSVVKIYNLRKTCTLAQMQMNGWTQQKSEAADAGMFGYLDYKDAYRVPQNAQTIKGFLDLLPDRQSLTIVHGSYAMPATWVAPTSIDTLGSTGRGTNTTDIYGWWSWFTGDMTWIGMRDITSAKPVYITLGATSLKAFTKIGQSSLFGGSSNRFLVQTEFVLGSWFQATAFKAIKGTVVKIYGTSGLGTIDEEYSTLTGGYGHKALDRYRPKDVAADPTQTQNLEHYVPKHLPTPEKQLVFNTGLHNAFWIGVIGVPKNLISYDVTNSLRHAVAYVDPSDDTAVVGISDHLPYPFNPTLRDSGIVCQFCAIRWSKESPDQDLYLWTIEDGDLTLRTSLDEAKTWSMSRVVASGSYEMVAPVVGENGLVYTYMLEADAIRGVIEDIQGNSVKALFTVLASGADSVGIGADEAWDSEGKHFIAIWYHVSGALTVIKSYDGVSNWL